MTSLKYGNSAHVKKFIVLGNALMTRLYPVYLTEAQTLHRIMLFGFLYF